MHSRLLGAMAGAVFLLVLAASLSACGDDDAGGADQPTLPPIVTIPTTAPTTPAPSTTQPQFYEVQPGDTLFQIAAAYGLPMPAIMSVNGITDPNDIQAGQILQLPSPEIVANALPTTSAPATTVTP
jgi:lipoprotein NlpD